jgi:hypothetical protein
MMHGQKNIKLRNFCSHTFMSARWGWRFMKWRMPYRVFGGLSSNNMAAVREFRVVYPVCWWFDELLEASISNLGRVWVINIVAQPVWLFLRQKLQTWRRCILLSITNKMQRYTIFFIVLLYWCVCVVHCTTHTHTHTHQYGPNEICSHTTEPTITMYFNWLF